MAVLGIYYDKTETELLTMREEVFALLKAARTGDRFVSTGGHGRSFTKDNLSYSQLRDESLEIQAALQRINPDRYGTRHRTVLTDFSGEVES